MTKLTLQFLVLFIGPSAFAAPQIMSLVEFQHPSSLNTILTQTQQDSFCKPFEGKWTGTCDVDDSTQQLSVQDSIEIYAYNNCQGITVGSRYGHIDGQKIISVLSPAMTSLGLDSNQSNSYETWSWSTDLSTLKIAKRWSQKIIGSAQPTAEVSVDQNMQVSGDTLVRTILSSNKRSVSCKYQKDLSQDPLTNYNGIDFEQQYLGLFDKIPHQPPAAGECTSFAGTWKGQCTFESGAYTNTWLEQIDVQQYGCEAVNFGTSWTKLGSITNTLETQKVSGGIKNGTFVKTVNWDEKKQRLIGNQDETFVFPNVPTIYAKTESSIFIRGDGKLVHRSTPHGNCYALCVYDKVK